MAHSDEIVFWCPQILAKRVLVVEISCAQDCDILKDPILSEMNTHETNESNINMISKKKYCVV